MGRGEFRCAGDDRKQARTADLLIFEESLTHELSPVQNRRRNITRTITRTSTDPERLRLRMNCPLLNGVRDVEGILWNTEV